MGTSFVTCKTQHSGGQRGHVHHLSLGFSDSGIVFQLIECEDKAPAPKPRIELPQRFRIRPVTPVEKYIKVCHVVFKYLLSPVTNKPPGQCVWCRCPKPAAKGKKSAAPGRWGVPFPRPTHQVPVSTLRASASGWEEAGGRRGWVILPQTEWAGRGRALEPGCSALTCWWSWTRGLTALPLLLPSMMEVNGSTDFREWRQAQREDACEGPRTVPSTFTVPVTAGY